MKKITNFIKNEPVFIIATILAIVSMLFVRPNPGYLDYIDFKTLSLLICLMGVVAGFKTLGIFDMIADKLSAKISNVRLLVLALCMCCYFIAMLITNDVALITFVPLTLMIMDGEESGNVIKAVVLETVAANLGSMLTPIGNPQNLYLYNLGGYSVGAFVLLMLPLSLVSLILIAITCIILFKKTPIQNVPGAEVDKGNKAIYYARIFGLILLFLLCLLNVFYVVDYKLMLVITVLAFIVFDRKILLKIDYMLILTFIAFFIFIGNLGNIPSINNFLSNIIKGNEFLLSILSSQAFSNVPAALLLSGFTDNIDELVKGVNVGGLGTLIASMASLISYKLYCAEKTSKKGKYMLVFTLISIVYLAILIPANYLFSLLF